MIRAPVERVFAFHASAGALEALLPPNGRVVRREGGLEAGARVELEFRLGPCRLRWVARHTASKPGEFFEDMQEQGPFRHWVHRHEFADAGGGACLLTDRVEFSLPGAPLADWLGAWLVRLPLRAMFRARHAATRRECGRARPAG